MFSRLMHSASAGISLLGVSVLMTGAGCQVVPPEALLLEAAQPIPDNPTRRTSPGPMSNQIVVGGWTPLTTIWPKRLAP